ncbi:unnamed protein product [marine sediment metagenome]|uniref:Uncharacterized protein n=1 Tax=marine sediment metagenome TaxID=412755 RepID=X1H1M1_9ZZZZ
MVRNIDERMQFSNALARGRQCEDSAIRGQIFELYKEMRELGDDKD